MRKISIDDIRIDGNTQGRVVIDQPTVRNYVDDMKEGDVFPPLSTVFDGTVYWLVDGFHRYHAYKIIGIKDVEVDYKPGTQEEAQVMSFGMNGKHGKARTNEDKRKVVEHALEHPLTKDKTNYELAKICSVSQPFVAAVRSPESKQKQEDAMKKHLEKKAKEISQTEEKSSIPEQSTGNTNQISSAGPDDEELQSAEMAFQADFDAMYKIIEADEPLKEAFEEVKKLNLLIANLRVRSIGLQNEKDEAVKMVKKLQKELDKIKGKK